MRPLSTACTSSSSVSHPSLKVGSPPGLLEACPQYLCGPAVSWSENGHFLHFFALSLARVSRLLSNSQGHGTSLSSQWGSMVVPALGLHFWIEKSIPLTYTASLQTCSLSDGPFSGEVPEMAATEELPLGLQPFCSSSWIKRQELQYFGRLMSRTHWFIQACGVLGCFSSWLLVLSSS